jgi:ligand-binding sensor domain-containing protein
MRTSTWLATCGAALGLWACAGEKAEGPPVPAATGPVEEVQALLAAPYVWTEWINYGVADGLPHHWVYAVKVAGSNVWVGTRNGAAVLDQATGKWRTFGQESAPGANDGLAFRVVVAIDVDEDGDVWFGTFRGLTRFDGQSFTSFRMPEGQLPTAPNPTGLLNNVVYGVTHLGDDIWVATTDGTSQYNKKSGTWKSWYLNNAPMEEVWSYGISASPDRIWLAAWGSGLLEYKADRGEWQAYHDPDGSFNVDLIRNDGLLSQMSVGTSFANGKVWVASYFGVTRYDGKEFRDWDEDHGLPSNFLNSVKALGDTAWVSSDKGLAGFVDGKWYRYARVQDGPSEAYGTLTIADGEGRNGKVFKTKTAIPHNFVWMSDFESDGSIWVATSDGLGHGTRAAKE